jgi:hypothetical protein
MHGQRHIGRGSILGRLLFFANMRPSKIATKNP